jgi:hypothetical protein
MENKNIERRGPRAPADFFATVFFALVVSATRLISGGSNLCLAPTSYSTGRVKDVMADRAGLGFVGLIFGGVTAAVMLVAVTIVFGHVDGRLVLDAPPTQIAAHQ